MDMRSLFVTVLLALPLAAETYEIRPTESTKVALTVEKTGLYSGKKHLFLFTQYQGNLDLDLQQPQAAKIQLQIDSRSLVCKDTWVSAGDLKKIEQTALEDMLAAKQHPSMSFTGAAIKPLAADRFEVQGTLTIRGIAKPALVIVQLNAADPKALLLEGSAIIRLKDYNLKPPSALLGAIGTKNEMTLAFTVIAARTN